MEQITIDLVPKQYHSKVPTLHASQYDNGRDFKVNLKNDGQPYTLSGTELITVSVKKSDNNLVSFDVVNTFGGKTYIEFNSTTQMCAVAGFGFGEISLSEDGENIGSGNFMLYVEPSPEAGPFSESEIDNLNRRIDDHINEVLPDMVEGEVPQVIGDNYYDKDETDEIFATKNEVEAEIDAVYPKVSKSGKIVEFETDTAIPLNIVADIGASESGVSSVKVTRCGFNLFNDTAWYVANGYTRNSDGSWHKSTNPFQSVLWENVNGYEGQVAIHYLYKYDSASASVGFRTRFIYKDGSSATNFTSKVNTFTILNAVSASGKVVDKIISDYGSGTNGATLKDFNINVSGDKNGTYEAYNGNAYDIDLGGTYYNDGSLAIDKDGHRTLTADGQTIALPDGDPIASIVGSNSLFANSGAVAVNYSLNIGNELEKKADKEEVEKAIYKIAEHGLYVQVKSASLESADTLIVGDVIDNKKNEVIEFIGYFDSFTSLSIGHGYNVSDGSYAVIDNTNITVYLGSVPTQMAQQSHSLTFSDFIHVRISKNDSNRADIEIITATGSFKLSSAAWSGCRDNVFAKVGATMTDVVASVVYKDFLEKLFLFGDSYVSLDDTKRYPYYLIQNGYTHYYLDGYGGRTSNNALTSFNDVIDKAVPNYVVWALGMNDTDSGAANPSWLNAVQSVIQVCKEKGVVPILATIPNTPTHDNYYKNAWVKGSGYRYVDFAKAVGAESQNSSWYAGMLSEDNVHPTALGAKALYARIITDVPEIIK